MTSITSIVSVGGKKCFYADNQPDVELTTAGRQLFIEHVLDQDQALNCTGMNIVTYQRPNTSTYRSESQVPRRLNGVVPETAPFFVTCKPIQSDSYRNYQVAELEEFDTPMPATPTTVGFDRILVLPNPSRSSFGVEFMLAGANAANLDSTVNFRVQAFAMWVTPEVGAFLAQHRGCLPPNVVVFYPLDYTVKSAVQQERQDERAVCHVYRVGVIASRWLSRSSYERQYLETPLGVMLRRVVFGTKVDDVKAHLEAYNLASRNRAAREERLKRARRASAVHKKHKSHDDDESDSSSLSDEPAKKQKKHTIAKNKK